MPISPELFVVFLSVYFVLNLAASLVIANTAKRKGRSFWAFFWLAFIFSALIMWIIAVTMSDDSRNSGNGLDKDRFANCPFCAEVVRKEARVCMHCKGDIGDLLKSQREAELERGRQIKLQAHLAQEQAKANRTALFKSVVNDFSRLAKSWVFWVVVVLVTGAIWIIAAKNSEAAAARQLASIHSLDIEFPDVRPGEAACPVIRVKFDPLDENLRKSQAGDESPDDVFVASLYADKDLIIGESASKLHRVPGQYGLDFKFQDCESLVTNFEYGSDRKKLFLSITGYNAWVDKSLEVYQAPFEIPWKKPKLTFVKEWSEEYGMTKFSAQASNFLERATRYKSFSSRWRDEELDGSKFFLSKGEVLKFKMFNGGSDSTLVTLRG